MKYITAITLVAAAVGLAACTTVDNPSVGAGNGGHHQGTQVVDPPVPTASPAEKAAQAADRVANQNPRLIATMCAASGTASGRSFIYKQFLTGYGSDTAFGVPPIVAFHALLDECP